MRKVLALTSALFLASTAYAAIPEYGSKGTRIITDNPDYGTYVAPESGTVVAYFLGKEASYTSNITLLINGVASPESPIFPNTTTPLGSKAVFGNVKAGDVLSLQLTILRPSDVSGTNIFGQPALNTDGWVHTYSENYFGGDFGIPEGRQYLYVGFEDIVGDRDPNFKNDWDYDDHRFVFDIEGLPAVPEPATWMMMIGGFGLVGLSARRRRRAMVSA